jgi:hippurate hydrolase
MSASRPSAPSVPSAADGDLISYLSGIQPELVALRRELHRIPEVGLNLPHTQARLLEELQGLPLEITLGRQLSGITAVLRGRAPLPVGTRRPVLLLRGDMDALPEREESGVDFASTNGAMHACGHDLHMSLLVGAARALCRLADRLAADVVFMFQPGEEGDGGAQYMIEEGVLDAAGRRADAAYAIHVFSSIAPTGVFSTRAGSVMSAADALDLDVVGRGGHGSAPYKTADPVTAVAEMVLDLQVLVSRKIDFFDPAVISVGVLQSGIARNVIPDTAHLEATIRSFSAETQQRLFELIPPLLEGIATSHGVEADYRLIHKVPMTVTVPEAAERVFGAVEDLFGADRVQRMPQSAPPRKTSRTCSNRFPARSYCCPPRPAAPTTAPSPATIPPPSCSTIRCSRTGPLCWQSSHCAPSRSRKPEPGAGGCAQLRASVQVHPNSGNGVPEFGRCPELGGGGGAGDGAP